MTSTRLATPIFISYRRADTAGFQLASPLHRALVAEYGEDQVFWDKESMENGPFAPQLHKKVTEARTVFILIGDLDRWLGKRDGSFRIRTDECWVRHEVRLALAHRPLIIPVYSGGQMPEASDLPDDLQLLLEEHFEPLPPEPRWETDGIERLVARLKRQTVLDRSAHAVLRRLIKPLRCHRVDVCAALSSPADKQRLWTYFQAAQGIRITEEERFSTALSNVSLEAILEELAMTVNAEGLFRFLAVIIYREQDGKHVFPGLPEAVREEWRKVLNEACDGSNKAWDVNVERLSEWAKHGELAPSFHICFDREQADDRVRWHYRISGWICLGADRRKLDPNVIGEDLILPWSDSFANLSSEEGRNAFASALSPLFNRIAELVNRWMGGSPLSEHRPVVEVYVRREQIAWPVELASLDEKHRWATAGQFFRISRRLHMRHAAAQAPAKWEERTIEKFRVPLRESDVIVGHDWSQLRVAAGHHGDPVAFAVPAPADESVHDLIHDLHLICGLWIQGDSAGLTAEHLRVILTQDGCSKAAVRDRRGSSSWRDVIVLHDPHPSQQLPGLPDPSRARKRTCYT